MFQDRGNGVDFNCTEEMNYSIASGDGQFS